MLHPVRRRKILQENPPVPQVSLDPPEYRGLNLFFSQGCFWVLKIDRFEGSGFLGSGIFVQGICIPLLHICRYLNLNVMYPTKTKMNFPPTDANLHGNHSGSSTYTGCFHN